MSTPAWLFCKNVTTRGGSTLKETDIYQVATKLSGLIPTFKRKFVRPVEQEVRYALTPLQMHVMNILSEKEYCSMTELSQETRMCKQQMTPLIDKLIDSGLVSREPDMQDRRLLRIRLTKEGNKVLEGFRETVVEILKEKIQGLGHDDLESLSRSLDELYRIFQQVP